MKTLVINCGSSSLKYQLIDMSTEESMVQGLVERIGIEGSILTQKVEGKDKYIINTNIKDHKGAIKLVLEALVDSIHGVIKSMDEISAVGHRVVHGGEKYSDSVLIDDEVLKSIKDCIVLAPLHNPPNVIGIEACKELMPNTPMVAVFDTAFHQTMPEENYLYALPYEWCTEYKIRRYGAHGTSHKFVALRANELLGRNDTKLITCHIGNGASISAVVNGKCLNTSMGLTPNAGLIMGSRCGDIDATIVPYMIEKTGLTPREMDTVLNKKSGLLGISGISSDSRDIEDGIKAGNERCILAQKMYVRRIIDYIVKYYFQMDGCDAIIFTAGVGENSIATRASVVEGLHLLGIELDPELNDCRGKETLITTATSKIPCYVIPTNEELMIARDTYELAK